MERNGKARGLLSSLAGMPGASTKTEERVHFDVGAVEEAIESIRRLQGTGSLTINFHNGRPNGKAAWKPSLSRDDGA